MGRARGFTLVELLVGLTIATFIMGSASVVFVVMTNHWDRGKREQRLQQVAQTTSDLIERYLRCALVPKQAGNSGTNIVFTGEDLSNEEVDGHRLTFISTAEGRFPRSLPRTDASEIEFCYDPEEEAPIMTMRIDATPDEDATTGGMRVQLSSYIQGFRVMYFDGFEWISDWSENQLPQAVEFHLIIGDPADVDVDGNPHTREYSRLVWLPLGKALPEPQDDGSGTGGSGSGSGSGSGMGGGTMGGGGGQ